MLISNHRFFLRFLALGGLVSSKLFILRVAHQELGVLTLSFDPSKSMEESLQMISTTEAGYRPSWLHSKGKYLYSLSRSHFPDNSSLNAGIFCFEKYPGGHLHLLNTSTAPGDGGVYMDTNPHGTMLASANIDGATVSVFPRDSSGMIGDSTYVFRYNLSHPGPGSGDSQEAAYPHAVVFDPSGNLMLVPDRGSDSVSIYRVTDVKNVSHIGDIDMLPGTGPRHAVVTALNQTHSLVFLVGELDNTINVIALKRSIANCKTRHALENVVHSKKLQSLSTLAKNGTRTEPSNKDLAAEIALSDDNKFLYVSNRNTRSLDQLDSLAVYSVNLESAQPLEFLGLNTTHGKIPRHFSLSRDDENRFIAVTNQVSNNLIIMERDITTGFVEHVVGRFSFGDMDMTTEVGPVAVIWD